MKGPGKVIAVAVVWILIFGAGAGIYRLFKHYRERDAEAAFAGLRERYVALREQARKQGLEIVPWDGEGPPLPPKSYELRVSLAQGRLTAWGDYKQAYDEAAARGLAVKQLSPSATTMEIEKADKEIGGHLASLPALANIAVSLDSFSGYFLLRSKIFNQQLATEGLRVTLHDDRADYKKRLRLLQSGKIPLALFTIGALLKVSPNLPECSVILVVDETRGADAMVAYESALANINALNQRDVSIVLTPDSPSETLALVVRAHFDLPDLRKDAFVYANSAEEVYNRLQRVGGRGGPLPKEAYVLWEPYVSQALEVPGVHRLTDSGKLQGYIVDVLVAQRDYLKDPGTRLRVLGFVKAYLRSRWQAFQGASAENEAPAQLLELVAQDAERLGETLSPDQALALARGVRWKNTVENYAHFGLERESQTGGVLPLTEIISNITRVLVDTGAIEKDPTGGNPGLLLDGSIVRELKDTNFYPGRGGARETLPEEVVLPPLSAADLARLVDMGGLKVENLGFSRGGARLTRQSQRVLSELAKHLRSLTGYLLVKGSARADGDPEANRQLAQRRADAAREYLIRQGVATARVYAVTRPAGAGGSAQSVAFELAQMPY